MFDAVKPECGPRATCLLPLPSGGRFHLTPRIRQGSRPSCSTGLHLVIKTLRVGELQGLGWVLLGALCVTDVVACARPLSASLSRAVPLPRAPSRVPFGPCGPDLDGDVAFPVMRHTEGQTSPPAQAMAMAARWPTQCCPCVAYCRCSSFPSDHARNICGVSLCHRQCMHLKNAFSRHFAFFLEWFFPVDTYFYFSFLCISDAFPFAFSHLNLVI